MDMNGKSIYKKEKMCRIQAYTKNCSIYGGLYTAPVKLMYTQPLYNLCIYSLFITYVYIILV